MQHAGLDRLADMEGIEYALIHFQYPILYVIQVEFQISNIFYYYIIINIILIFLET